MNELPYKIATLLSFLLIGTGSLLEAYKNNPVITSSLVGIAIVILVLMSICIIIYIYIQTQNDIIFKFNKKNKTLECINNSNHTIFISDTKQTTKDTIRFNESEFVKPNKKGNINIVIPLKTKDILSIEKDNNAQFLVIFYNFILQLPNDYCKGRTKIKIIKI